MKFKMFLLTMFMFQVVLVYTGIKNPEINMSAHIGLATFFLGMLILEAFMFDKKED